MIHVCNVYIENRFDIMMLFYLYHFSFSSGLSESGGTYRTGNLVTRESFHCTVSHNPLIHRQQCRHFWKRAQKRICSEIVPGCALLPNVTSTFAVYSKSFLFVSSSSSSSFYLIFISGLLLFKQRVFLFFIPNRFYLAYIIPVQVAEISPWNLGKYLVTKC